MTPTRRKFRRAGEEERRQELIEATLAAIAERGLEGTTVREIAQRAGVTAGLIRHYFPGKEDLLQAAYAAIMDRMTQQAKAALEDGPEAPRHRLAGFVQASLTPPVIDPRIFSLWANFIGRAHADRTLAAAHRAGYLRFRDEVEQLVAAVLSDAGRPGTAEQLQRHAIAINALIDGLWIEGCLAGDMFNDGDLAEIGISATEALLAVPLRESAPAGRDKPAGRAANPS